MEPSIEAVSTATVGSAADPVRRSLAAVAVLGALATISGTLLYAYPTTLAPVRGAMLWAHDASGDLLLLAGAIYLRAHLGRTWRMWRRVVSRRSGYTAVIAFSLAGASGVYAQAEGMTAGSGLFWLHALSSVALVVLACFHGAYGLLRTFH